MERNVTELIRAIEEKAKTFHANMMATLTENEILKNEIDSFKKQLEETKLKSTSFESKILELKNELSLMNKNAVVSSKSDSPTQEEMNELIKEIDFCIEQIKK